LVLKGTAQWDVQNTRGIIFDFSKTVPTIML
jgi:hypothetical protein